MGQRRKYNIGDYAYPKRKYVHDKEKSLIIGVEDGRILLLRPFMEGGTSWVSDILRDMGTALECTWWELDEIDRRRGGSRE